MKRSKHSNIPIFIPELACPHQCVFCDQEKISGSFHIPSPDEVPAVIEQYLDTMSNDRLIDIAFFGGNFTGISIERMEEYLSKVCKFVEDGKVDGIRLSTRPDYIDVERLQLLKRYSVTTIELGAQSTNDKVLQKAGRGHDAKATRNASELILDYGFRLGLQMMIGLPGDSFETSLQTAYDIVDFGASNTRIYPAIVVKGTTLEKLYNKGKYKPLELDEAVQWTKSILEVFENNDVDILRVGLHPSEELIKGKSFVAGPFHPSFKELVMTEKWKEMLKKELNNKNPKRLSIKVNPAQLNYAIGYKSYNRKWMLDQGMLVKFLSDPNLKKYEFDVSYN